MHRSRILLASLGLLLALGVGAGTLLADWATPDLLGGSERAQTHVSTDKPIYEPGQRLFVRAVVLDATSRAPVEKLPSARLEVIGPKGDTVASGWLTPEDSVLAGAWDIPKETPGGEYTLKVVQPRSGYAPAERKVDIRAFRAPRIKSQIEFVRDGYGPGDTVVARLHAERAEGGAPAGATVTAMARVDGEEVARTFAEVDRLGNCVVRFQLPEVMERGEGSLALRIEDGGVLETASKTIPILLQTVDVALYPEGGDLVAGLAGRVYFEARTPYGKPADVAGAVVDARGVEVATFRSEHEGRGRFTFTPAAGTAYELRIDEPTGITGRVALPEVAGTGVTLSSGEERFSSGAPISLTVASTKARELRVTISQRERVLETVPVAVAAGATTTIDLLAEGAEGVLIATVWDSLAENPAPLAERLVFREPSQALRVAVRADRERYVPGDRVSLEITTTTADGEPVPAVVGLTVTDDTVLEMIEKREMAPRLPVMALLEDEVGELADAHVYLDPANPEGPLALDLLLGTQGWRRFALVDVPSFLAEHGDAGRRVLAMRVVTLQELAKGVELERQAGMLGRGARFRDGLGENAADDEDGVADAPKPQRAPVEDGAELAGDEGREAPAAANPRPEPQPDAEEAAEPEALGGLAGRLRQELRENRELLDEEHKADKEIEEALEKADRAMRGRWIGRFAEEDRRAMRNDFAAVRVYAHEARADRRPGDRRDFAQTLYWNAGLTTDENGKASVTFDLSDSVTSFAVHADGFSGEGALGAASLQIDSVEPFYTETKLPLEVTEGDELRLPISLVNGTYDGFGDVRVQATLDGQELVSLSRPLAGDSRVRELLDVKVDSTFGDREIVVQATAGNGGAPDHRDATTRTLTVVPRGFPVEVNDGGMIGASSEHTFAIEIPASAVPGSVRTDIAVYPTPLASLTQALERLLREPHGCFEQTSSTNYPLIMAQQYFKAHPDVDPQLMARGDELLAKGYDRLVGFECPEKGYEWFGSDPGHEALTAYGLLEFTDMSEVYSVDPEMMDRTRTWLLGMRDGEGGFKRERRALHTWITDPDCSNAYITWALLESGTPASTLEAEIASVKKAGLSSPNTYVSALAANVLALAGDEEAVAKLRERLATKQAESGVVENGVTTIVGSRGKSLDVETTALAVLAWLPDSEHAGHVEKAVRYLADACEGGRFGSTQSTVLALRAIVAYDKARSKPKAPGTLRLFVDGRPAGEAIPFDTDTHGALEFGNVGEVLTPGKHQLKLVMEGGAEMPFAIAVRYHAETPNSSSECPVGIAATLTDTQVEEGSLCEVMVTVRNESAEAIPTPIAIVGLPGSLEVRHDQLKELVKAETIAAYEVIGREVVLYWRDLGAGAEVNLPLSCLAAIPGTTTGPASRAYLYYGDEHKTWIEPIKVEVLPQ